MGVGVVVGWVGWVSIPATHCNVYSDGVMGLPEWQI